MGDFDRVVYVGDYAPAGWVGEDCGAGEAEGGWEVEGCCLDLGVWWSKCMLGSALAIVRGREETYCMLRSCTSELMPDKDDGPSVSLSFPSTATSSVRFGNTASTNGCNLFATLSLVSKSSGFKSR